MRDVPVLMVSAVYRGVASSRDIQEVRGADATELARRTSDNATRLFRLG